MNEPEAASDGYKHRSGDRGGPEQRRPSAGHDGPRCLAVMYHYVHDREPLAGLGLSGKATGVQGLTSGEFAAQLDQLCGHLEPIDWPTLYAWTCGRGSIPERCFLLTFDDGLADHAEMVLPVLEARGLRGVFFVTGAELMSPGLLPAHAIHLLLSFLDDEMLERELLTALLEQGGSAVDWKALTDPAAAEEMYHYETPARARLKYLLTMALPVDSRNAAINAVFEQHIGSSARWARHWYLGWEDLVRMQAAGHTIGAHGYCHEPYTRLSPTERRQDLRRVAVVLRSGLGSDIRPLSYPYGQWDDDTRAACREAGFAHAFTTEKRWIIEGSDVFALPRVDTIDVGAVLEDEVECTRV